MKDLLDRLGPVLEGRGTSDIPRFDIYQRFCAAHRRTALAHVFVYTKKMLAERWDQTVEAYFRAHPMFHVEINMNGAHFPSFLTGWLAELADFEWWEWQTRVTAGQAQRGLAPTVEIRPYHYDFIAWDHVAEPAPCETLVVFWRDRDDDPRRGRLSAAELEVIRAAYQGQVVPGPVWDDLLAAGILAP